MAEKEILDHLGVSRSTMQQENRKLQRMLKWHNPELGLKLGYVSKLKVDQIAN